MEPWRRTPLSSSPLAGIALPLFLVPTVMAMRQAGKKREFEHLERMRALETGQPIPGEANWAGAMACAAVGAGVPLMAYLFTFLAYINQPGGKIELFIAPTITSLFAFMGAGGMATAIFRPRRAKVEATSHAKPQFDPDAYETVGR